MSPRSDNLPSSSRNLGTKSGMKKFDIFPDNSAGKGIKVTSNYLIIGVKERSEKEAKL